MIRLKPKDLPTLRDKIARRQAYECPICDTDLMSIKPVNWCLDHDHVTGKVRGVLCRQCNGSEGRIKVWVRAACKGKNPAHWLRKLADYLERYQIDCIDDVLHPTFKTEEEKREARNAKARKKRATAKKVSPG